MDDKDLPIYFVSEFEPKSLIIRIGVGAIMGAAVGALLYLNDNKIGGNVMNHVNRKIVENYHPTLLKKKGA